MKKSTLVLLSLVFCFAAVAMCGCTKDELNAYKQQLDKLQTQYDELQQDYDALEDGLNAFKQQLDKLQTQHDELQQNYDALEQDYEGFKSGFTDLSKLKVGDKIPVYPSGNFSYIVTKNGETHVFNIDSVEMTLSKINDVQPGENLSSKFYPYEVTMRVVGKTDSACASQGMYYLQYNEIGGTQLDINEDGNISAEKTLLLTTNILGNIYFYDIH